MSRKKDVSGVSAWHALMTAHAVLKDRLEGRLRRTDAAPLAWLEVLALLDRAEQGAVRMQELADHMVVSKSGLTRLVDRMEAAGLVVRRACSEDRRGVHVAATDEGRATFRRAEPELLGAIDEHFGRHLSDEDVEQLEEALNRVLRGNDYEPHLPGIAARGSRSPRSGA